MVFRPRTPRDQRLLIVALLAIGLALAYHQFVWSARNRDLDSLATRLDTLDSLNRFAKTEVVEGSATRLKREADRFARELSELRRLVPTENELPALLESISRAARHAGLEISGVAPDGIVNGDQYDTYKYKLVITGPYHQVSEFLSNIGSLSLVVAPINVTLLPSSRPNTGIKTRKGDQLLEAKLGILTYVAHAPMSAPKAAAEPKSGATKESAKTPVETALPPPPIYRERYAYMRDGRRDPFYSLLLTSELRPTMNDLRLTGVQYDPENRKSSATLRDVSTPNTPYRVNVGSTLGRMRVSSIRNKTVVFTIEELGTTRRDSLVLGDTTTARRP
jgi:type IV pilus assembly protein PilO